MRIIIIGFGTVGEAFARILQEKKQELLTSFGFEPKIIAVVDVNGAVVDPVGLGFTELSRSRQKCGSIVLHPLFQPDLSGTAVINSVEADVVVEATPTNIVHGEPGLSHIMAALKKKRHVVTTNKGPLALALPALMELASYNDVCLRFSGTVGGGTPILDLGKKGLLGDKIISIKGILNGTTNYILTRMSESMVNMDVALKEAQQKGYAETDPSYDLEGIDSACKLVIMANWLKGKAVTLKDVEIEGITEVTLNQVRKAKTQDCAIKLIASMDEEGLNVQPQSIPRKHPLCIGGALNAVTFQTEYAGEVTIIGRGAGGSETGGAVLRDLIDIRGSLYNMKNLGGPA